ncbi:MAG: class II fructose-bisphosphate aldolase [Candidatus Pacebacteria bacterium]|nr:class II fructose-bisphosphate aldolase [Candidatus Paceibacterota bacterium]
MKTLKEYLFEAKEQQKAIAHFNVANSDMLMSVFAAAKEVSEEAGEKIPLVIGVSEGERDAFGVTQIVDYVTSLRNEHDYPVFLNADHTYSVERTCEAIDAGFDMVIYDGAKISHEENLENTKKVVAYRNEVNPNCLVEAEFGFIGSGSSIKDEIPEGVSEETMTKPDEAKAFVDASGVEVLAPSVGNIHGMVKSGNPALNPERVASIWEATKTPLVLHGGSGSSDEDFLAVIRAGISLIHISTELRVVFRKSIEESFAKDETLAPYKYFKSAKEAVQKAAAERIRLFWGMSS